MILKNEIIEMMRKNTRIKVRLAYELKTSYPSVRRWMFENKPNGNLTTIKAVQIISEELQIPMQSILEENIDV